MTNEELAFKAIKSEWPYGESVSPIYKEAAYDCISEALEMKDEQFKEQLSSLKYEIQSNLCASSGFNDEYSRGYQDCGMKVMEMIDKILNK